MTDVHCSQRRVFVASQSKVRKSEAIQVLSYRLHRLLLIQSMTSDHRLNTPTQLFHLHNQYHHRYFSYHLTPMPATITSVKVGVIPVFCVNGNLCTDTRIIMIYSGLHYSRCAHIISATLTVRCAKCKRCIRQPSRWRELEKTWKSAMIPFDGMIVVSYVLSNY